MACVVNILVRHRRRPYATRTVHLFICSSVHTLKSLFNLVPVQPVVFAQLEACAILRPALNLMACAQPDGLRST
jgi:hypothetical protein